MSAPLSDNSAPKSDERYSFEEKDSLTAPSYTMSGFGDIDVRRGFIIKVYGILTVQLAITFGMIFGVVFISPATFCGGEDNYNKQLGGCVKPTGAIVATMYSSVALSFAFLCAITCCVDLARKFPTNYVLLFGFTICEAVMLSCACLFVNAAAVGLAAVMTFLVTAGLTAFACTTKTDFTGMGPYLFAGLLSLMVFGFVASMVAWITDITIMQSIYAWCGCLLFSLYIVYDTQLIVGGAHTKHEFGVDDYVFAAINIYLDIINLFMYILTILNDRR